MPRDASDSDLVPPPEVADGTIPFERYSRELVSLVLRRLDRDTRRKADAEDIVQSAIRSFLTGQAEGRFEFRDPDDLWKLLVVITLRKCRRSATRLRTLKRDVRREVDLPVLEGRDVPQLSPQPEEVAVAAELLDSLLRSATPAEREIILARLEGYSPPEIAERVRASERKVFRVLAATRARLADA